MSESQQAAPALVLFDIDGTLIRRSGPEHRFALEEAVRRVVGKNTTTAHIPVQGMLDRDILAWMMRDGGVAEEQISTFLPEVMYTAQELYEGICPDLQSKVCPGVRDLLDHLSGSGVLLGLVTGNLSRIAWKKMEKAGLRRHFRFGAFAEDATTRAGLAALAVETARRRNWLAPGAGVTLVGDHPNDILAAKENGIRSVAVATGVVSAAEMAAYQPDCLVQDFRELPWRMVAGLV